MRAAAIVSDRVGCHPDLVLPGDTGAVFPFGDVGRLGDLLADWAKALQRVKTMGDNARRQVREYSVSALVQGTRTAVEAVTRAD